jgi:hypothetical protein
MYTNLILEGWLRLRNIDLWIGQNRSFKSGKLRKHIGGPVARLKADIFGGQGRCPMTSMMTWCVSHWQAPAYSMAANTSSSGILANVVAQSDIP